MPIAGCITFPDDVLNGAHWAAQQCYDFFDFTFFWTSYNGFGADLIVQGHYNDPSYLDNAFWNDIDNMFYLGAGNSTTSNPVNSIDIMGHEFTHALIHYTCGLNLTDEAGALSESFGDMLGTALEFWSLPQFLNVPNWKFADKVTIGNDCIRNLEDPGSATAVTQCADTYNYGNWYSGSNQQIFPYVNAGVGNKWFYLLSEGGSGTNAASNNYCVNGIGIETASQIVFATISEPSGGILPLSSNSNYSDARAASYKRAEELYGIGSPIASMVAQAWYAVGVGPIDNTVIQLPGQTISGSQNYSFDNDIIVSGSFHIQSGATCDIISSKTIELNDGFLAEDGSTANIEIAPVTCPSFRIPNNTGNNSWQNSIARKKERDLI